MEKTAKANAKINLYLNVCGKREDGYHEIETVMQEISLCDISGITTKAPCEAALMDERHVHVEISNFVTR